MTVEAALFDELRQRFLERIDADRLRFATLLAWPVNEPRRRSARMLAHRIAGGGGTLGLERISLVAAGLERALGAGIDHRPALRDLHEAIELALVGEANREALRTGGSGDPATVD